MSDADLAERLRSVIVDVPDFPRQGVVFKDITGLLGDAATFRAAIDALAAAHRGENVDHVVGVEARGFIVGGALAYALGCGFVPVRKQGKLPRRTVSVGYSLEYGEGVLEMHADALRPGERVLVVDDLLATGGTAAATVALVEKVGATVVGVAFLVELSALGGAQALRERRRVALVSF